ncbi:pyruvate kinase [Candidatus Falkowbacteria bacterium]|nr:pyruvate kinase [Candidatus Falkowbacteria bacterium]
MKTKIVITVGPKTANYESLLELVHAGAEMIRLNFSHATFEQFLEVKKIIKKIEKETGRKIYLIQDLQGPRIRVGKLPAEGVMLTEGSNLVLSTGPSIPGSKVIHIDDNELYIDIEKGDPIYLSNGEIELIVTEVRGEEIYCRIIQGGLLVSHKGVNVPNTNLKKGGLTRKDIKDVRYALENGGADYIALSFVQTAEDVRKLRALINKYAKKGHEPKIVSKIERGIALKNIDEIIVESDVIMFARGDLGIEVPIENLPIIQKNLIRHAHWHNTPVIIATQVLTSMIVNSSPTRAEVSDISNAIFDRADAVMLSDETAVGAHPIEAVKILKKVIRRTEEYLEKKNFFDPEVQRQMANKYSSLNN